MNIPKFKKDRAALVILVSKVVIQQRAKDSVGERAAYAKFLAKLNAMRDTYPEVDFDGGMDALWAKGEELGNQKVFIGPGSSS